MERHSDRYTGQNDRQTAKPKSERLSGTMTLRRAANECAQCGEPIYMPEWSEWLNPACTRHLWRCEACDYTFETTVHFAAA